MGFSNFAQVLGSEQLWGYFATTGRFAFFSVALQTILGFSLAMLVREKFRGSGIVTTLILIPMMLSPVVVGLFRKLMYNRPSATSTSCSASPTRRPPGWLAGRFVASPSPAWRCGR